MLCRSNRIPKASLLLTLIIILTACSGNPSSGLLSNSQQSTSHKLVVYVLGLGESLSTNDASQNSGYGYASSFYSPGGIQPYLQGTSEFANAQSLVFSYGGFISEGKPDQFSCKDTFNNQLAYDAALLNLQITQYLKGHPNTDVYIVSHSLGGVVAFGYMASLIETTHSTTLVNNGKLKGIAILDSPLGGVTNESNYEDAIIDKALTCDFQAIDYTTIGGLQTLFNTASSSTFQGETGSVFSAFIGGKYISNQDVASYAAKMGVRILVVGNTNDLLWQPDLCFLGASFLSTEYLKELREQSNNGALYSRSVTSGFRGCRSLVTNKGNHFDVLYRTDVKKAIWKLFTGKPIDQLSPAPKFTPDFTPFVGRWWAGQGRLTLDINSNGLADFSILSGRSVIQLTKVVGNTAYGTVVSGDGIPPFVNGGSYIPVGGNISMTLQGKDTLQMNGWIACRPPIQCVN